MQKKMVYLYLMITFFGWGSSYAVSKFVLGKIPVITILFFRFLIAGAALYLISRRRRLKAIERQDYKYIFLIGFLGYFFSTGMQLLGTKLSNASLASLVNSMNPVSTLLFASVFLNERLTIKKIAGIALAVAGVYIILGGVNGRGELLGVLFSMFAVISWSLVSILVRKITQKYDSFQVTTYGILFAVLCSFPFSIYELATTPHITFDWTIIPSLLFLGLVCTAMTQALWSKSLSVIDAGTCSLFYPLQPMFSALLGWMFLGEQIGKSFIAGAVLIIGGVLSSVAEKKI